MPSTLTSATITPSCSFAPSHFPQNECCWRVDEPPTLTIGSFDPDSTPGDGPTADDDNASVAPLIADLSVTKTAALAGDTDESGTLTIGDDVVFTITFTNAGFDLATGAGGGPARQRLHLVRDLRGMSKRLFLSRP